MFFTGFASLVRSTPPKVVRVYAQQRFTILCALHVFINQLWGDADNMLTFPVLDHVESLEGTDDVLLSETSHCTMYTHTHTHTHTGGGGGVKTK